MKESKKSLFSLLLALSMVLALFVAWPTTAYAATGEVLIDVSDFVGASSNMHNGGEAATESQWSYDATSHVLGLNTENGNYKLTGNNNSITVYNINGPGVNVTFDNLHITAPNNYSNLAACITSHYCTIHLVGSSSLDATNSTALKVDNGSHCTITSSTGGELYLDNSDAGQSCIYLDHNTDISITDNTYVIVTSSADANGIVGVTTTSHQTVTVDSNANLLVTAGTAIRADDLNLVINGKAFFTGTGAGTYYGYGINADNQVLAISGTGSITAEGAVSALNAQSILMDDQITLKLVNDSSNPETHTFTASNTSSSLTWKLTGASFTAGTTASDSTVSITVPAISTGTIWRSTATAVPVCKNVDTGLEYETLAAAVTAAASGETIQLLDNIDEVFDLEVYTKNLTIDMAGFDISMNSGKIVTDGHILTIENGGILQTNNIGVYNGSTLIITADLQTTDTTVIKQSTFDITGHINSQVDGILADTNSIVSVKGNITTTGTGVELRDNAKVTVKGNIKAGNMGVELAGVDSVAEVFGNIEANTNGIDGFSGTAKVIGNIYARVNGIFAIYGCKVTILGSIYAADSGVEANHGAVVVVEDGITTYNASDPGISIGVNASDGASVTVNGPISTSGVGVYAFSDTDPVMVTVNSTISAASIGISARSYGGSLDIVVNGDITALGFGVYAEATEGPVSVTVKGDIYADGYGIDAFNINGAVTVSLTGNIYASDYGVNAHDEGTLVEVTGNITADKVGLYARESSVVKLIGDIVAGDYAVDAENAAKVTIQGSIIYEKCGIEALGEDTLVTMTGNLTDSADQLEMDFWGGAIYAGESAKVVLNGNITTHDENSTGVQTFDNATVIVNGSITTSGVNAVGVYAASGREGDVGGSEVTINGNITSTDAIGVGVFSAYGSKVTVNGTITAPRYVVLLDTTVPSGSGEIDHSITSNDATSSISGYLQYSGGDPLSWVWVRAEDEIVPPVVEPPIVVPPVIVQPKPPVVVPSTGDAGVLAGLSVSCLLLAAAFSLLKRRALLRG
jgi:hypothetical protein